VRFALAATLLTVILPVRNGEAFIEPAIRSVLNQSFSDFELWVIENGSTDRTVEIVRSLTDSRIKLFQLGPVGLQGALKFALENTKSEWLARMDADDLMFPNRLQVQLDFVRANPEITFVGTASALLTPFGHIIETVAKTGSREVTKYLLASQKRFFADPSVVFNRRAALEAGGIDNEFSKQPDVPLWFRLLTRGKAWELAEPLHLYRLQANSLSKGKEHGEQSRQIRAKYAPELSSAWRRELPQGSFWQHIARLALISGDMRAVRRAAVNMKEEGPFESEANRMVLRTFFGKSGSLYYRWRNRDGYRRRSDLETQFSRLLQRSNPFAKAGD
jgi:glycosyltransferase involved in cell wall biosynthesis